MNCSTNCAQIQPIVILGAMDEEVDSFRDQLSGLTVASWGTFKIFSGDFHGKPAVVAKSGVGKVLSAMLTQYLILHYRPRVILFSGLAGALSPQLEIGDIVVGTRCVQHDFESSALGFPRGQIPFSEYRFIEAPQRLVAAALAIQHPEVRLIAGTILSGDQFMTREREAYLREIQFELGGDAVEMEGAAVALVSHINAVDCLILRTISDLTDHSAALDFATFLPQASAKAYLILKRLIETI